MVLCVHLSPNPLCHTTNSAVMSCEQITTTGSERHDKVYCKTIYMAVLLFLNTSGIFYLCGKSTSCLLEFRFLCDFFASEYLDWSSM